jgi:hypothetical protein
MAHFIEYYVCGKHVRSECRCPSQDKERRTARESCPECFKANPGLAIHNMMAAGAVLSNKYNRSVYKYPIPITDNVTIDLPVGAEILSVGVQKGVNVHGYPEAVCLWALVTPASPVERRRFRVVGTGHPISSNENLKFIGTVMLEGGALVFHVFEWLP